MCDVTVTKNVLKLYLFLLYYLLSNIQILSQKKVYKKLEGNSKTIVLIYLNLYGLKCTIVQYVY